LSYHLATLSLLLAAGRLPAEGPADALAARIDFHIEAGWKQHGVKPSPPADDAAFLRRAWLDLAGKVPPITEARDFLDDPDPDKRVKLVRRLLRTDDYARHTATLWGRQLFTSNANPFFNADQPGVAWLRQQVKDGVGYDRVARALVSPPQGPAANAAQAFLGTNQNRADSMAAATARHFLGVRLECAQCHNHPFADWKREQFWQLAAFFSDLPGGEARRPPKQPGREITIPNTERLVPARFLDGAPPRFKAGESGRGVLADWVARRDNPWFAKAAANRVWARYFGTGIVEPPDDMRPENPPSHPELLDELARAFADGGCDERLLAEAILTSKTYQLSSAATDPSQDDPRRFARAAVRGLTPEQVFDSLAQATGNPGQANRRNEFLARFAMPGRPTEAQTPVLQALYVMNGPLVAEATRPGSNPSLRVLAESAVGNPERCVEELYLNVLVRPPTPAERARLVQYIRSGGPHGDTRRAVADVYWVLLNSSEFVLNH
jgi:hypothetical protein